MSTTPTTRKTKNAAKARRTRAPKPGDVDVKIVRLVPRHLLERVMRGRAGDGTGGCHKCGSLFVEIEPAFVHCRYCGSLSRIHGASLLAQEEWEQRSGMRLAS